MVAKTTTILDLGDAGRMVSHVKTGALTMEDAFGCTAEADDRFGLLARSPQRALNGAGSEYPPG